MDGSLVLHHDENGDENPDEILARRLKNRERQRRYRARKRQEADLRKSSIDDQSTPIHYGQMMMPTEFLSVPVEVEISVNLTSPERVTRVHCSRDWKKDARRAHVHKKRELSPSTAFSECEGKEDSQLDHLNTPVLDNNVNNATHGFQSSRRHWKAEARNKKQVEDERNGVTGVCL